MKMDKKKFKILIAIGILIFVAVFVLLYLQLKKPEPEKEAELSPEEKTISIIKSAEPDDLETPNPVDEILKIGPPALPALLDLLEDEDLSVRETSLDVLAYLQNELDKEKQKEIIPYLKKKFDDFDSGVRVVAAATAVNLGEKSGIPVLIDCLRYEEYGILWSDESVSGYSNMVLKYRTDQDFGYDESLPPEEKESAIQKWTQWWETNKDSISWNEEQGKFISK